MQLSPTGWWKQPGAVLAGLLTVVNTGIALSYPLLWVVSMTQGLSWRADFTMLYTGGMVLVQELATKLYDFGTQADIQQGILGGRYLADGLLPFNYPPHVALLMTPFAKLALLDAYILWSVLQFGLIVVAALMIWHYGLHERFSIRGRVAAVTAVLAMPALLVALLSGALSTVMLIALLGFAVAIKRRNDASAGLWVLVASLKPQVAVIPAIILLFSRRWRGVLVMVIGSLIIGGLCAALLGVDIWFEFAAALFATFRAEDTLGVSAMAMTNLRGLLAALLPAGEGRDWVSLISFSAFAGSAAMVAWLWMTELVHQDVDLVMALSLLIGVVFSLHVNPQDGLLVAPAALLFCGHLRRGKRKCEVCVLALLACPALLLVGEYLVPQEMVPFRASTLAAFALVVSMALDLRSLMRGLARGGPNT